MKTRICTGICLLFACALFAQYNRPIVTDLTATAMSDTAILLEWKLPEYNDAANPIVALNLYRDMTPIRNPASLQLDNLIATLSPTTTFYTDRLNNTLQYFYAVVVVTRNFAYNLVSPSVNATIAGITVQQQLHRPPQSNVIIAESNRGKTLPLFGVTIPGEASDLDIVAVNSAANLAGAPAKAPLLPPYVFDPSLAKTDEAQLLRNVVTTVFFERRYEEARKQFSELIKVSRVPEVATQAQFYLGECQYFLGDYRAAITSFLITKPVYPELSYVWITSTLNIISR